MHWRRVGASLFALAVALAAAPPVAAERTLVIQRFDARVDVDADGSVTVEETIVPRFSGTWNGIFRTIPVEYRTPRGLNYTLRLDVESVTDERGNDLRYESSRERHYRKLKIWVPGASDAVLEALRDLNLAYEERFGYIFIVCATGKSAEEMLALLKARLDHDPADELAVAAAEQAKITRLRLEKLSPPVQEQS